MHQLKVREDSGQKVRFYSALGLVAAATLMLQIIETGVLPWSRGITWPSSSSVLPCSA